MGKLMTGHVLESTVELNSLTEIYYWDAKTQGHSQCLQRGIWIRPSIGLVWKLCLYTGIFPTSVVAVEQTLLVLAQIAVN